MGIKKVGKLGKGFPTVSVIRLCMTQIKSVQLKLIINNRCINRCCHRGDTHHSLGYHPIDAEGGKQADVGGTIKPPGDIM